MEKVLVFPFFLSFTPIFTLKQVEPVFCYLFEFVMSSLIFHSAIFGLQWFYQQLPVFGKKEPSNLNKGHSERAILENPNVHMLKAVSCLLSA